MILQTPAQTPNAPLPLNPWPDLLDSLDQWRTTEEDVAAYLRRERK